MEKRYRVLTFLIIIIAICSSCSNQHQFQTSLEACKPPCWNGITPGETNKEELLLTLQENPIVESDTVFVHGTSWKIFNESIEFSLTSNEQVEIYLVDDIVVLINLLNIRGITFQEAINILGEPEKILSTSSTGPGFLFGDAIHINIYALSPDDGIGIYYDANEVPFFWRSEVNPRIEIASLDFFDPESFEDLANAGMFSMGHHDYTETIKRMHPWAGYGKIEELYPLSGSK
jgi:hypothetical protein